MSAPRILLVTSPDWSEAARRDAEDALRHITPWATIEVVDIGTVPPPGTAGVWLMAAPAGASTDVHDATIGTALHLGIPLLGSLAVPEGGPAGGRGAGELLAAPGTVWRPGAVGADGAPTLLRAEGHPFALLSAEPLTGPVGPHPRVGAFGRAVSTHASWQHPRPASGTPMYSPDPDRRAERTASLAPLRDDGVERSYVHQMRTGDYRWWRPVLALAAGAMTFFVSMCVLGLVWFVADPEAFEGSEVTLDVTDPVTMLINNLTLAALIPATLVATRLGHWRPMGKLWSVAGRMRWGWLARASLVTLVVWGGYLAAVWFLLGEEPTGSPDHVGWLVLITLLTTPLQAAGEEVAFRGGLLQGVGAWIRNPVVALVAGAVLSTAFFALAHMSLDPWILLELGSMAACACYLTWRTGGLEAAIALHVINNLVITVGLLLLGGLESAYVSQETTSDAGAGVGGLLANVVMTAILLHQARRAGVAPKGVGRPATG